MRITLLPDVEPRPRRVAVGEFDGVHLGHRDVIEGSDTVLTFEPHPLAVIRPEAAPKLLTTLERKAELVAELGVEELVVIPFDEAFAQPSAEDFVAAVLVERLRRRTSRSARTSASAPRAGRHRAAAQADERFETRVEPLVEVEGEVVSSLAHPRTRAGGRGRRRGALPGRAVRDDRRGRDRRQTRPRARLPDGEPRPRPGADPARPRHLRRARGVRRGGRAAQPSTSASARRSRRTSSCSSRRSCSTGEGDLYGRQLTLEFLARLRGERRFDIGGGADRADARATSTLTRGRLQREFCYGSPPMSTLTSERKQELVSKFGKGEADTG